MKNDEICIDEFLKDISLPRTKEELHAYYKSTIKKIESDQNLIRLARLKKGLFKEFFEELVPLLIYSKSKYCEEGALLNIVVGNQKYDAIVKTSTLEKRLEFSKYANGKIHIQEAKQLNKNGYTDVIVGDVIEAQNKYLENFRKCLIKKSKIGYKDTEIIFIVDDDEAFRLIFDFNFITFKNRIIELINDIDFGENIIYLMLPKNLDPFEDEHIILIK
jgi:hypothetical protein